MEPQPPAAACRPAKTKAETAITITLETNTCYRESKFPAGHPARECHVGLAALDPLICSHCTWYGAVAKKQMAKLTGEHRVALVTFLKRLQQDGVPGVDAHEPQPTGWLARLRRILQ
ncbi:MAG: hypothetical protein KGZ65_04385 [Sphingomonadales bacterium]|nr:hypothetical protein [Sphingomonadaceae bacterium]MBS3930452.1 hypothetical protein [Sphingomonadales bacterium]